ncbi:hypothetical protein [Phenylobacterium sp.]|uniref:hypothetical protein n=1 Tax=Phenylobacterium sp. TaxID=1871053 RepID=UPI00273054E1|nr:hypothetical protein [Phenylobacterium sp.]MDP1616290.1 hypothetical protein [Phenylobacterium sp.]MDP1987364.1 hypothetical protein [Phenylobacterium sp.]
MTTVHRARISPLLPVTEWTLDAGDLVERRGARVRRFPLSGLRRLTIADGLAQADFAKGRARIPARSFASGLKLERREDSFIALTEALAAQATAAAPQVRMGQARPQGAEMVIWTITLCGAGAVAVLGAAGLIGAWALGLALAARLVFVLILAAAVLPWIGRPGRITTN